MASDTVTIKANGVVTADDLKVVAASIADLLAALTREQGTDAAIDWAVSELRAGSAMVAYRGLAGNVAAKAAVALIVSRFDSVARNAHYNRIDGYSPAVQQPLRNVAGLLGSRVTDVLLGTDESPEPWSVAPALAAAEEPPADGAPESVPLHAYVRTAIKGKVVTLDDKRAAYFTLERAYTRENIRCYPDASDVALRKRLSEYWAAKTWIIVEGRYHQTARPPTLYHITDVVELPPASKGSWRQAGGVAPRDPSRAKLEVADAIEKVRDGEE